MAQSVLAAVVTQLRNYTNRLTAQHNQAALVYDREQVKDDQTALAAARSKVTAYQAQHPGATQSDPNYCVARLGRGQRRDAARAGEHCAEPGLPARANANGWLISVIDPPSPGTSATPR